MYKSLKRLDDTNGYTMLAEAIIMQAVKDYRDVLEKLKYNYDSRMLVSQKRSLERFFSSRWFKDLSSIDGKKIARRLREEAKAI